MQKNFHRAFTIVELLMVIGIIGVLTGIVTTAAAGAMKNSRVHRAKALCALVQQGLAVYYAQEGSWPVTFPETSNTSGTDADKNVYILSGEEVRTCCKELAQKTKEGKPVIDVSGLFVSRTKGELYSTGSSSSSGGIGASSSSSSSTSSLGYGMDFMTAIHGSRANSKKMKLAEMYFGYPDPTTGKFLRFYMKYSIPTDAITVTHWPGRGW